MSKTKGSNYEREYMRLKESQGFSVHRIAGSGSNQTAIADIILVKNGKSYFVECKKRKDRYYISENKNQIKEMVEEALRIGAIPILAVRLNRKGWIEVDLSNKIPQVITHDIITDLELMNIIENQAN